MSTVSVIVPAYNAMEYLPETINSILLQTYSDFEIVIINDGSEDGIESWYSCLTDSRVKMISQPNQGKSVAVNNGIKHSQGEFIAFLDADDLWEATKLEKQVCCLDSNPEVGLVYSWTAYIDGVGKPTGRVLAPNAEGMVWESLVLKNLLSCGSNPMVRRHCFDVVGVFSPELPPAEDWDMWLRIAVHFDFAVIKLPLVRYRKHAGNISSNWHLMEQSSSLVLERAFRSAPVELLHLYDRAYRSLYLYLGWLAIHKQAYQQALYFWRKSQITAPKSFSSESTRLRLAIFFMRWLGGHSYLHILKLSYRFRRCLLTTSI